VALFFSGRRHAGENLTEVLKFRAAERPPPIQMCDALSRNLPGQLRTILAHCLAHARRQFVEVYERFPEPCRYLLEALAVVYRNDAMARERQMSPEARLQWHQEASGPTMQQLHEWLTRQPDEKLTEPNSALGGAIRYMLRHWERLTLNLGSRCKLLYSRRRLAPRGSCSRGVVMYDGCDCCASPIAQPQKPEGQTALWSAAGSVVSAVVASACCWVPVVLLAFGVLAAGVSATFEEGRPFFQSGAAILLGVGFYLTYFRKEACAPGSTCAVPNRKLRRIKQVMLWVATALVLAFAFFPNYAGFLLGRAGRTPETEKDAASSAAVNLNIRGMTCEACAVHVEGMMKVQGIT
jgi:hypothetical protein